MRRARSFCDRRRLWDSRTVSRAIPTLVPVSVSPGPQTAKSSKFAAENRSPSAL